MDRADMTHPLTPREKVARALSPKCWEFYDRHVDDPRMAAEIKHEVAPSLDATDAILTALASDSGDHAELAALCRYVQEARDNYERTIRAEEWTRKFTPDLAYALIAENAALRSVVTDQAALHLNMMRGGVPKLAPANIGHLYRGEEAKEVIAEVDRQNPGSNTRATEAEAELREHRITADLLVSTLKADKEEAERKLAEAVGHMSWMRVFVPTVWDVTEERLSEIDAFLSKEAERGPQE